jgi:hypothetical protein
MKYVIYQNEGFFQCVLITKEVNRLIEELTYNNEYFDEYVFKVPANEYIDRGKTIFEFPETWERINRETLMHLCYKDGIDPNPNDVEILRRGFASEKQIERVFGIQYKNEVYIQDKKLGVWTKTDDEGIWKHNNPIEKELQY